MRLQTHLGLLRLRERHGAEKYGFLRARVGNCMSVHKAHNHARLGSFDPPRV